MHWIRIRQLILDHGSDLAEQPAPEQWERKWKAEQLEAPGTKATNFLSVLDNAVVWVRELELLVTRSWERQDYSRWQPRTPFPFLFNTMMDQMLRTVKERESKYVKSVAIYRGSTVGAAGQSGSQITANSIEDIYLRPSDFAAAAAAAAAGAPPPTKLRAIATP